MIARTILLLLAILPFLMLEACLGEPAPPERCPEPDAARPEASAPYCGDHEVNQDWEQCDDGNTIEDDYCQYCRIPTAVGKFPIYPSDSGE